MSNQIPDVWQVSGHVLSIDGITPFSLGTVSVFDVYSGTESVLGVSSLDSSGYFSVVFSLGQFQHGDPNRLAPDLILRVHDYQGRVLFQSDMFVPPSSSHSITLVLFRLPIPDVWNVYGTAYFQSESVFFTQGNIHVYCIHNGSEHHLAETGFDSNGHFTLTFSRSQFQFGDVEKLSPEVIFRIYDYNNNLIWEYGTFTLPSSEYILNPLVGGGIIPSVPNPQDPEPENWSVFGKIRDSQGYAVTLGTVRAYDVYNNVETELGSSGLSNSGNYSISFPGSAFRLEDSSRPSPNIKVRFYYPEGFILLESEIFLGASPALSIDLSIATSGSEGSGHSVYGNVSNKSDLPVAHHQVNAYSLFVSGDSFSELFLGSSNTDVHGNYEIFYDPSILSPETTPSGECSLSLFIKLPSSSGSAFDVSPLYCHSSEHQRIDIHVDRLSGSDVSEYDTVKSALSSYLSVLSGSFGFQEQSFLHRISYISCKTDVEESKVACFYHSIHFSTLISKELSSVTPPLSLDLSCDFEKFMYASFRSGYPATDARAFFSSDPGEYYSSLVSSIRNRIIPESVSSNLSSFWSQWLEISRALSASAPVSGAFGVYDASFGVFASTVLGASKPVFNSLSESDYSLIRKVVEFYQESNGDLPSFWNMLCSSPDFSDLFVAQLSFISDLYSISNGFLPFAQGAYYYFAKNKTGSYGEEINAYNIRNLSFFSDSEWLGMTYSFLSYTESKYPSHLTGSTNEEKVNILSMATKKLYKEKFPAENASAAYSSSSDVNYQNIGAFLSEAEDFNLDTTNIDGYDLPPGVNADLLKSLQRVSRLTDDPQAQIYLLENGYDSSYRISVTEEENFVADNALALGGIDEARQIHRLAAMYSSDTLNLLGKFHNSLNFEEESLAPVNNGISISSSSAKSSSSYSSSQSSSSSGEPSPTYKTLFGTLSEVRFENAQSVFGASAYFADLLEFIESLNRANLFARRPELKEIELTDGNAETVLPYIDIVLEILENAIIPRDFFLGDADKSIENFLQGGSSASVIVPPRLIEELASYGVEVTSSSKLREHDGSYYLSTGSWRVHFVRKHVSGSGYGYQISYYPQTGKDSKSLSVIPEHRNPRVYERLSGLYFPLNLPLSPCADEVQETLRLLDVSKHDSIAALLRDPLSRYDCSNDQLVCANLGINANIKNLIEGSMPDGLNAHDLWGFSEGELVSSMSSVSEFMRRTSLDVEGMLDILALDVLSEYNLLVESTSSKGDQTGDPDYFNISGLDSNNLVFIHRLIRLRNIFDCSWKDLDRFLISAYGGSLPNSLGKIHCATLFMSRHSISLANIGCFWGDIPISVNHRFGKSPFEERFIASRLSDSSIAIFKELLSKNSGYEDINSDGVKFALRQVLQLSAKDLDLIIGGEFDSSEYIPLNLANISKVLRVSLFCGALKLGFEEFYSLRDLCGIDPFDSQKPENILYFDDERSLLSERGLKASAIKKLLFEPASSELDSQWVFNAVRSLREIPEDTEAFLNSDAVPVFDDSEDSDESGFDAFKKNYREENTNSRVKALLSELFSEFSGGSVELASHLLCRQPSQASSQDLWMGIADVGWTLSLNEAEGYVTDDFSIPEDFFNANLNNSDSKVVWSAVFIAPRDCDISFKLDFDACDATLNLCKLPVLESAATCNNEIYAINVSAGDAILIEISVSNFDKDFYLDLQWNASTESSLSGTETASWSGVPVSALIPFGSWAGFEALESTLPVFRKMSEYLSVTGASPDIFKAVYEKSLISSEWEVLQPEELPLKSLGKDLWKKFCRFIAIQSLHAEFPVDDSRFGSQDESGVSNFWKMIDAVEAEKTAEGALALLADIQNKWDCSLLKDLVKYSKPKFSPRKSANPTKVRSVVSPAMLSFILESMPAISKIGIPLDKLAAVQIDDPKEEDVLDFRGALQQSLGMSSWNDMVESMMNVLRVRQRDAMTAFIIIYGLDDGSRYRDSNELYARFLIDTEMNTEMTTSRIVQGSAAIQLFVQRILLGLEPSSRLDDSDISRWTWVKNYRLWEANRKVFLYPENWIEPELRDDKTPFFEDFESKLGDGELTSESAKEALSEFLGKIKEVSGLEIAGAYRSDSEIPRGRDTIHVIGRTKSVPRKYYYRRCHRKSNLANVWTPWEPIDVSIQSDSVIPVMFNGHLHLFWAQFNPVDNPDLVEGRNEVATTDIDEKAVGLPIPENKTVVEVLLCWSALVQDKWTENKQTSSFIDKDNDFYTNKEPESNVSDSYHFAIREVTAEYVQIELRKTFSRIKYVHDKQNRRSMLRKIFKEAINSDTEPDAKAIQEATAKEEKKMISVAGVYKIWHNGHESFSNELPNEHDFIADPKDTILVENHSESYESSNLYRFNGLCLLGKTSGGYKFLAANSGHLTGSIDEPGFLIEDTRTYLIQRSDNGKANASYKMESLSHPIVKEFQRRFDEGGLFSLMRRETQALAMATGGYYGYSYYSYNYYYSILLGYYTAGDWQAWDSGQNAFELRYRPNESVLSRPFPMEVVDFNYGTPNGIYNWELFFHAPFLVARQLSANHRYEEALEWYQLIFDPRNKLTSYEKTKRWALKLPSGARFWNFLPFFSNADADKTIMELMGLSDSRESMPDSQALQTLIDDWKDDPFNPHLIARSRIVAYQKAVVMHYLDTLIAWADQNFRVDTLESINEAIQLYILAAEILGQRPQSIPSALEVSPLSYTQMHKMSMDNFSNVAVQLENSVIKLASDAKSTGQGAISESANQALSLGPKMYYFTVPRNEKLIGYWDLLDDRLFKIRNGMNIDGVRRQLSLFAPPIDPGMLVKAAAAGIDIGTALSDMFAPVPKYRFTFMVQKAIELCGIAQSMGAAVLSALEKKDAEDIARLRAEHESTLLNLSTEIRKMQIEEAGIAIDGLKKSRESAEERRKHYDKLISEGVSVLEHEQLMHIKSAATISQMAGIARSAAAIFAPAPNVNVGVSGFGGSAHVTVESSPSRAGSIIASVAASILDYAAIEEQSIASTSGINAGYERRGQEWEFQMSIAEKDVEGIDLQILGAQIRKQVAEKELGNLEKQISQSEEAYAFLKSKYTNKELYNWMVSEISSMHNKIYQLAYDTAKKAEKTYGFELGIDSSFIQFGYWDGLRKGLLAGERLTVSLKQMEMSYIEKNSRELEITKPISIAQLNPSAIYNLQESGSCEFSLPEALFDIDFPGHYFRRIRSVRLTIPCVAGPYASVSATLTLLKNSMRKSSQCNPAKGSSYRRGDNDDTRFIDQRIGIQGIATSQPDGATGVFDFNFRDERYLPFEGAGAISEWRLELPKELRQFDYRSISDVVLHVSYTARADGGLKNAAEKWIEESVDDFINSLSNEKLSNVISVKRNFPDAWQSLREKGVAEIAVSEEHFPYFLRGMDIDVENGKIELTRKYPAETDPPFYFGSDVAGSTQPGEFIVDEEAEIFGCTIKKKIEDNEEDIIITLNYSVNNK